MTPEESPRLFTAVIPARHILGIFHERNEAEAVVNPLCLRGRLDWETGIPVTNERVSRLADQHTERKGQP